MEFWVYLIGGAIIAVSIGAAVYALLRLKGD